MSTTQAVDLISKQSALAQEISASRPSDPEDQEEFDALRDFFAENLKKIEHLLEEQVTLVEALSELFQCEPVA